MSFLIVVSTSMRHSVLRMSVFDIFLLKLVGVGISVGERTEKNSEKLTIAPN